ncbi:hypothetical protein GALMADRAFT_149243 [Galerina marginata CBS 339.88]|uniref:Uncharacterized protein n=1 Tax=Galerina marginata (strain CBS 339.88) TaxID=685588 RepID=A0A067S226_GALM3|nr:hypothetical protein GALMADRAFT_149243 [Galerina marginata CBS 339.88]
MPQVICTCYYCCKKTVVVNGVSQPGSKVDSSTRLRHEKKDRSSHSQSPSAAPQNRAGPSPAENPGQHQVEIEVSYGIIIKMIMIVVVWLNLRSHLSRSAANTLLQAIQITFTTTLILVQAALAASGFNNPRFSVSSVVLNALALFHGRYLGDVNGKQVLVLGLATQTCGNSEAQVQALNGSLDVYSQCNHLIHGFGFFFHGE